MRYLARRAVWTVLAVLGVSVLIFFLVRLLPGNIVDIIAGPKASSSRAQRAAVLQEFGLDQPLPVQYLRWLGNMLQGNFGWSFRTGQPVAALIASRLPITIELALLAVLSVAFVAIPLGVAASVSRSVRVRTLVQIIGVLGLSLPNFWIAILLIIGASSLFGWLPALIYVPPVDGPVGEPAADVPPRAVAGARTVGGRHAHDPVVDARGAGAGLHPGRSRQGAGHADDPPASRAAERADPDRHGPRPPDGLPPGRGGDHRADLRAARASGWTLLNGVYQRDYPVVQGTVMVFAVTFVLVNLLVDLAYTYLDPRIRYE